MNWRSCFSAAPPIQGVYPSVYLQIGPLIWTHFPCFIYLTYKVNAEKVRPIQWTTL